ncbi:MAG: hypothetical protein ACI8QC_000633 [Planctomycetota bacterium]
MSLWAEEEQEQLVLCLRGKREALVHAGKATFRSDDGFVVFQGDGEHADGLLYVHDSGSVRMLKRVD